VSGDPHWADVVFLSGFEGGAPDDESPLAQTVTTLGTAAVSSAQAKFGTQSLRVPAASGVSVPDHASFFSGNATPFTIEGFWRWSAAPTGNHVLVGQFDIGVSGSWQLAIDSGTSLQFQVSIPNWQDNGVIDQIVLTSAFSPTLDTWYFIAVDFDGTTYRSYTGTSGTASMADSVALTYDLVDAATSLKIGTTATSGTPDSTFDGYIDEIRVTSGTARYASDAGATVPTEAFPRGLGLEETIEEGIGIYGGLGYPHFETLAQTFGASSTLAWGTPATATDTIGMTVTDVPVKARPASAEDAIGVAEATIVFRGVIVLERLRIALSQIPNHNFQLTTGDELGLNDNLRAAAPVLLAEGIGLELTQQAQQAITVIEALELTPLLSPLLTYGWTVSEAVTIADALGRFFGAEVSDEINVAPLMGGYTSKDGQLSETIGLTEGVTPRLVLRVIATDTIGIEAEEALRMLFSPAIAEGIQLSAAYLSPDSSITTWAMNTRTAAVSEYQNYAFNSFARLGNKYIGANEDGLYELTGDDDAGTDIVATIRSGFAQWSGTHLGSFKAAYLAIRGEGSFVLRVVSGDGRTYNYSVTAESQKTVKVNMGKGLRARYFAFELVSTGQDFDLDTLEFIPLVADRRV
jgi:hypothetical protein